MEEILASIRRIIADDDALPLTRRPSLVTREPAATPASPGSERPLDFLRPPAPPSPAPQMHIVAVPEGSQARAPEHSHERDADNRDWIETSARLGPPGVDETPEGGGAAEERMAEEYELRGPVRDVPSAEGEHPNSVIAPAHQKNEETRLISPATDASVASSFQSLATSMFLRDSDLIARTAREMLRPMLKQWLDDNLPVMVERLVRAEIERVARGGR